MKSPSVVTPLSDTIPSARFDKNGRVLEVNDIWLQYCGFDREEVVGRTMKIIQGRDTEPRLVMELLQACRERRRFRTTITNYTKRGVKFANEIELIPDKSEQFVTKNQISVVLPQHAAAVVLDLDAEKGVIQSNKLWDAASTRKPIEALLGRGLKVLYGLGGGMGGRIDRVDEVDALRDAFRGRKAVEKNLKSKAEGVNVEVKVTLQPVGSRMCVASFDVEYVLPVETPAAMFDKSGRVLAVNDPWLYTCGFDRSEVVGATMSLIQGPRTEASKVAELVAACRARKEILITITNYDKNKQAFANSVKLFPIGVDRFITHNNIEFMLDEAIPSALFDEHGRVLKVNDPWLDVCGFRRKEVVGKTMKIIQGPKTELGQLAKLLSACRLRRPTTVPITNYTKEGHMFENLVTLLPVGKSQFVTRNKISFKLVKDQPSALFDSKGSILDVNALWLLYCGYAKEEILGQTAKILQGPETEKESVSLLLGACLRRERVSVSVTNYTKSGCKMTNTLSLFPVGVDRFITLNHFKYRLRKDIPSAKFDQFGRVTRVNNVWLRYCGFRRHEVVGETMRIIQGPATEPDKVRLLLKACRDRKQFNVTITNYTKSRLKIRNQIKLLPVGVSDFITENLITFVLEESCPAARICSDGTLLDVNDRFVEAFGVRKGDLVGASWTKVFSADDAHLKSCLQGGGSEMTLMASTATGDRVNVRASCVPATTTDYVCCFHVDYILDDGAPSVLFDNRGTVLEVNEAWLDVCGFSKEEVVGRTMRIIQGRDTEARKVRELLDACEKRREFHVSLTNYTKDRTKFTNHLHLRPVGTDRFMTVSRIEIQVPRNEPALRFDEQYTILEVSEPWVSFVGAKREDIVGSKFTSHICPEVELEGLHEAVRRRNTFETVLTWHTKDGVRIEGKAVLKPSIDGCFVLLCSLKYALPQRTPAALFDSKGAVLDVNNIWLQYCGFKRDEVIGHTMRIIQGKETEASQVTQLLDACKKRTAIRLTITNYTKDRVKVKNDIDLTPVGTDKFITVNRFKFVGVLDTDVASCICDRHGNVVDANELWLQFCEYKREEVVGKSVTLLSGEETEERNTERLLEAISTGTRLSTYITNYSKSGTKFLNSVMVKPVGEYQVVLDCHMRVLLRTDVASALFDKNGRVKDVNGAWINFCEFKREDIVGKTMALIQGPETEKGKVESLLAACRDRKKLKITITNYTKSGHMVANTIQLKPVGREGFITTNTFQFKLSKIVPSLLVDAEGRVEDVNELWLSTCEYTREEVIGKVFQDLLKGDVTEKWRDEELKQILSKRTTKEVSFLHFTKSNRAFLDNLKVCPVGVNQFIMLHRITFDASLFDDKQEKGKMKSKRKIRIIEERNNQKRRGVVRPTPGESLHKTSGTTLPLEAKQEIEVVATKPAVLSLTFVHEESWHKSYVRTRHKNLRCFPFCSPSHRERSFCGLPIIVMYPCESAEEAKKLSIVGSLRKMKDPLLLTYGDRYPDVARKSHANEIIAAIFTSYDTDAKLATYEFRPPRKWRYKCEQNKYTTSELHAFTVYLLRISETSNELECVGSKDSPAFNIVSAWNQSLKTVSRPLSGSRVASEVQSAPTRRESNERESWNPTESLPPYVDAASLDKIRKGRREPVVETPHQHDGRYADMYASHYYAGMGHYHGWGNMIPYYDMYPTSYPHPYAHFTSSPQHMYPPPYPQYSSSSEAGSRAKTGQKRSRRGLPDSNQHAESSTFPHVNQSQRMHARYMPYQFPQRTPRAPPYYMMPRSVDQSHESSSSSD